MERKSKFWSIAEVRQLVDSGIITFDNPNQRPAGLWTIEGQSLLIDSIFTMFIPDIYAILIPKKTEEGETIDTYDIVDGKQRLTTILSYLADEWALTELEPVKLAGEKFNISGLKFSELPESLQRGIEEFILDFVVIITKEGEDRQSIVKDLFIMLNSEHGRLQLI